MLSVADSVSDAFADLFPFTFFNEMQSRVLPSLLESDDDVVVAAPTASGKTVLAELAMVRELSKPRNGKILYLAPLRALTNEKEGEWQTLFAPMGFSVYVVSGERELDPVQARDAHVIISTPEKWDSASRKHSTTHPFVKMVSVIVIDEVHLLDSDERGGVLEALITRMKRITKDHVRIVALSATMPNIDEVARWIGAKEERTFAFDESFRPVLLKADVFGYNPGKNKFVDKYIRLYKAASLIEPHLASGQALIFVGTRADTSQAASKLAEIFSAKHRTLTTPESERLASRIKNKSLSEVVRSGIGFHHAGLTKEDRGLVEEAFKEGCIKILVSTSTLAWGVNLPARVVVIRDIATPTDEDISSLDLLQMLGRAGRPQYDEQGFGWVIAPRERVRELARILREGRPIHSQLRTSLDEHLNAEISTGTIKNSEDAQTWLEGTFYYVQHPESSSLLDDRLRSLIQEGFVAETQDGLSPTDLGTLASKYYLRLGTARTFQHLREGATDDELLDAVASAEEFTDVVVRRNELSTIKRAQSRHKGPVAKVYAILNTYIERGDVPEALRSDAWLIRQNALRLLSALQAFLLRFNAPETVLRGRILALRLEYGAPEELCPLLQLDGVGIKQASQLHARGVRSPFDISPKMLPHLIVGTKVMQSIARLPNITIDMELPESIAFGQSMLCYARVRNAGGGGRVCVTVSANGVKMLRDTFYAAKGYAKSIPVGVYGSRNLRVTYEVRIDHLGWVVSPQIIEGEITITELPDDIVETTTNGRAEAGRLHGGSEEATLATPLVPSKISMAARPDHTPAPPLPDGAPSGTRTGPSDSNVTREPAPSAGRCKHCGGSLRRVENVITCDCGVVYKLPSGVELTQDQCNCGLPKFKLKLFGADVCVDRQCENMDEVIAEQFAASNFSCPKCGGPLIVVRRKGLIAGCERYYEGCKTAFLLPPSATIIGRCACGLPRLQLKTKTRCLDTKCRM